MFDYIQCASFLCSRTSTITLLLSFCSSVLHSIVLLSHPVPFFSSPHWPLLSDIQSPNLMVRRLAFCRASTSASLQLFMDCNTYHRQGNVYGPTDKKKLALFIDDLNASKVSNGVQTTSEVSSSLFANLHITMAMWVMMESQWQLWCK